MYSKQETTLIKKEFWTSFGLYMRPVTNADGEPINWINYKTGVKDIFFRMDVDKDIAAIGIELHHADSESRHEFFNRFIQLKKLLESETGEEWQWQKDTADEHNKLIGRIFISLQNVSVLKKEDWPSIISFLKPRIIALDNFWSLTKDSFQ